MKTSTTTTTDTRLPVSNPAGAEQDRNGPCPQGTPGFAGHLPVFPTLQSSRAGERLRPEAAPALPPAYPPPSPSRIPRRRAGHQAVPKITRSNLVSGLSAPSPGPRRSAGRGRGRSAARGFSVPCRYSWRPPCWSPGTRQPPSWQPRSRPIPAPRRRRTWPQRAARARCASSRRRAGNPYLCRSSTPAFTLPCPGSWPRSRSPRSSGTPTTIPSRRSTSFLCPRTQRCYAMKMRIGEKGRRGEDQAPRGGTGPL